jgi:hypothetical protein
MRWDGERSRSSIGAGGADLGAAGSRCSPGGGCQRRQNSAEGERQLKGGHEVRKVVRWLIEDLGARAKLV